MLQGRPLPDFDQRVFDFIATHEGYERRVYLDVRAIPTVGVGYALLVREQGRFVRRSTLQEDFAGIHAFSADELDVLDAIAQCLNAGDTSGGRARFRDRPGGVLEFALSEDADRDGKRLFDAVCPGIVNAAVPADIREALAGTHELAALTSLAYNAPSLIGDGLKRAIRTSNRPAAWFEIHYRSNRSRNGVRLLGLHRRRAEEAALFGLYSKGESPASEGEARAVIAFLGNRKDEMMTYLAGVGRTDATGAPLGSAFSPDERAAILMAHTARARAFLGVV